MTENELEDWGRPFRKAIGVFVVLLVLAMFPFSEDPTGDIKYLIASWGSALLLAAWLFGVARYGWPVRRPAIFLEVLLLFLAFHVAASVLSSFPMNSFSELGKLWYWFVLYLVAGQVYTNERQIRRLMLAVCGAVAAASFYGLVIQKYGFDTFPWSDVTSDVYTNLPATFGNPNFAAHTLILAVVMAVYLASERRMVACLGFAALFLVHLRFTGQRAGWLALAAAVLLLVVHALVRRRVQQPVRAAVAATLIAGLLGVLGFAAAMGVSLARTGSAYPLDLSLLIRYKSYTSAAAMILRHPVLGWGTGNYRIEYPPFWTPYEQRWFGEELRLNAHVHNDLLEFAADAGLPAAGLYLAFLVLGIGYGLYMAATFKEPLKRRLGMAFAAIFTAFLVDGLFGFNVQVPVSAALLFLMAGAMEGFWSAHAPASAAAPLRLPKAVHERWKLAALAVSILYAGVQTGAFTAQVFYQDALGLTEAQQYGRADTALKWAERLAPWQGRYARQRGIVAMAQRDWNTAISHLNRALRRNPNYIMTLVVLSRAQMSLALSEAAQKPAPDDASLAALDTAEKTARQALKLCPMLPHTEEILGRIASSRAMFLSAMPGAGEDRVKQAWQDAENHLLRAIQYGARNSSETYRQLAQVRMALKNDEGAERAIIRATQADPADDANWPVFFGFACNSMRYDRFSKALDWRIARLAEKDPPDSANLATAYLWKASIAYDARKDPDAAEQAFRNAVTTLPSRADSWSAYARFAEMAQRRDSFKRFLLDTAANIAANNGKPLPHVAALAKVWREGSGALVDASVNLLNIVQGKVTVPGYDAAGLDMRWAILLLLEETRANPPQSHEDAGIALMHLGMVCAAIQAPDLADQFFPAAMPWLPADLQPVCAQHWADVLLALGRPNEAAALLQDASGRFPQDLDVKLAFARSLVKVNRIEEARTQYEAITSSEAADERVRKIAADELDKIR